jgi:hypothetical protein
MKTRSIWSQVVAAILFPLAPLAKKMRIEAEVERRLSVVEDFEAVAFANLQRTIEIRESVLQRAFDTKLCN